MNSMKPVFGDQIRSKRKSKHLRRAQISAAPSARNSKRRTVFMTSGIARKIKETTDPKLKAFEWKTVAEVARERGGDPLDVFFDLAIEDRSQLVYMMPLLDINEDRVAQKVQRSAHDDRHLRRRRARRYAVQRWLPDLPDRHLRARRQARSRWSMRSSASRRNRPHFFGIDDRGVLKPGMAADIAIFDFDKIGSAERPEIRHDLPGGGRRLVIGSARASNIRSSTGRYCSKIISIAGCCRGACCDPGTSGELIARLRQGEFCDDIFEE